MSSLENILEKWDNSSSSVERVQLTVRIPLFTYQRVLAFKELYPCLSVNEMVSDILGFGLNEIISAQEVLKHD